MVNSILKRDIFDEVVKYVGENNAIVLHGARRVGKTYILYFLENFLKDHHENCFYFDLEDSRILEIMDQGVDSFLSLLKTKINLEEIKSTKKKVYVLIDEIQYLNSPAPFIKLLVDHHNYLQLIVSGSSSFDIKSKFSDSLVGRTVEFEIFPLNFSEFLRFKKINIDLKVTIHSFQLPQILDYFREYVNFGGYPQVVLTDLLDKKEKSLQQIIDKYIKKDIKDLAKIKDIRRFNNLLTVLASQSGQLVNIDRLSNIVGIAKQTVENYLSILEKTYVLKLVSPFSSSAKVEIVKSPKVFFYDTGLLKMLQLKSLQPGIFGNIFETSIFSELVKKYGVVNINFWRSKSDNEVDFILQQRNNILPIEVKLNFHEFHSRGMLSFLEKYHLKDYKVVALDGLKTSKEFIYPWEI